MHTLAYEQRERGTDNNNDDDDDNDMKATDILPTTNGKTCLVSRNPFSSSDD